MAGASRDRLLESLLILTLLCGCRRQPDPVATCHDGQELHHCQLCFLSVSSPMLHAKRSRQTVCTPSRGSCGIVSFHRRIFVKAYQCLTLTAQLAFLILGAEGGHRIQVYMQRPRFLSAGGLSLHSSAGSSAIKRCLQHLTSSRADVSR